MTQDFKQLNIWQAARQFTVSVYKITNNFPVSEQFGLTSQLRRASSSITANIAEGCGRQTNKDFLRFLYMALGSLKECESFLILSQDLGFIRANEFTELNEQMEKLGKMLTNFKKQVQAKT